jgi:hypothetical protein
VLLLASFVVVVVVVVVDYGPVVCCQWGLCFLDDSSIRSNQVCSIFGLVCMMCVCFVSCLSFVVCFFYPLIFYCYYSMDYSSAK